MIDRNQLALMGVIVGTFGLVVGLGAAPRGIPGWAWIGLSTIPFLAMFLGGGLSNDAARPSLRQLGALIEVTGGAAYAVLFAVACVLAWAGETTWWFLALAPLGLVPAVLVVGDALGRLGQDASPAPDLFAAGRRLRSAALPSPVDSLRVIGATPPLLVTGGSALALTGLALFLLGPDDTDRYAMLSIGVFFSAAVVAGCWQALERWRTFVRPEAPPPSVAWIVSMIGLSAVGALGVALTSSIAWPLRLAFGLVGAILGAALAWLAVRVRRGDGTPSRRWLAQEGIVEESEDGTIVFPWGRVSAFDLADVHGRPVVRIWFTGGPSVPFHVLGLEGPRARRDRWIRRRVAALERSKRWAGADLLMQRQTLTTSPGAVFETLRRVAGDPASVVELPSVLDDPPAIDFGALGLGRVGEQQVDA